MSLPSVLLTGAFGSLGSVLVETLTDRGHPLTCFDIDAPGTRAAHARLSRGHIFKTLWGDLRDAQQVRAAVTAARPAVIIHLGAIIPTPAYMRPALAQAVNVGGTRNLVEAAATLSPAPAILFASSFAVHGSRNAAKQLPLLDGDSPCDAADNYGRHKIECERLVRDKDLPWTILRFGSILPLRYPGSLDIDGLRLSFEIPAQTRDHAVHVRDAALAVANAVDTDEARGKVLMIGGDDGWRRPKGWILARTLEALGIGPFPDSAYCPADPGTDGAWYTTDWMDTRESQRLLRFQEHRIDDYFIELARNTGPMRHATRLAAPLVRRALLRYSPYHRGPREPVTRPLWDRICSLYGVDLTQPEARVYGAERDQALQQ